MSREDAVDERALVLASVLGLARFDAALVASALRRGTLSKLAAHGLANLIEGKHPEGLKLVMQGQKKGWKPALEAAASYERVLAIGDFVSRKLADGDTKEGAVIDASEAFEVSEATIYRDLRLYEIALQVERESKGAAD